MSSHPASSRSAIRLTRGMASSHPASSWPATLPARGMLSSRPASWLPCPSNGPYSLSFKAIQLLKKLIPN
ncbi:UNVERIFIED_CONTAM: hypothetical protein Slati_0795200 [Sesamum latifolium]|uniref:Uncharacterized protein n=1 Tax=Sesamum latifolium TaxID=2727402 RepID=A0AAW2XRX7_9LAMI